MIETTKAKKPRSSPRAYPSFHEMISDAIVTLKERTGSSQYAITKFLEEKHKKQLPVNFRKLLLAQLKKFVASQKLLKVKNSFKLPSARPAPPKKPQPASDKTAKPKPKAKPAAKPKVKTPVKAKPAAKPKKAVAKPAKVARTKKVTSLGKKKAVVGKPKSVKSPTVKRGAKKK